MPRFFAYRHYLTQFLFLIIILNSAIFYSASYATDKILNLYAWTGEIPDHIVRLFENKTGIKVNLSTYENNEIMYAKLRTLKAGGYDIVMPSSYFVERMARNGLLAKLDKTKLPNLINLNQRFVNPPYDPHGEYSIPFIWGATGMFINRSQQPGPPPKRWQDLWQARYRNQLMLLDDMREVFSMALLCLGYSINETNPQHIRAAFIKLKNLLPNLKVFSTETVVSNIIDEDTTIGMAWNGDTFRAASENKHIGFIYPQDGFVLWVDNFSIPTHAPHKEAAYMFINFVLRADIAKEISLTTRFPSTNHAGTELLPDTIKNSPLINPGKEILNHGQFQRDLDEKTLQLYENYWEELKIGG